MPMPRKKSLVAAFALATGLFLAPQLAMPAGAVPPAPSVATVEQVSSTGRASVTKSPLHMTASFSGEDYTVTRVYALSPLLQKEAEKFLAANPVLSEKKFFGWFSDHGARLDNPDGPAKVEVFSNGLRNEQYWQGGRRHREDGPAVITTAPDGYRDEEYWIRGKQHREDGPAQVRTSPDGRHFEAYWQNGQQHREDGPAVVETRSNGALTEFYFKNGKFIKSKLTPPVTFTPAPKITPPGF